MKAYDHVHTFVYRLAAMADEISVQGITAAHTGFGLANLFTAAYRLQNRFLSHFGMLLSSASIYMRNDKVSLQLAAFGPKT